MTPNTDIITLFENKQNLVRKIFIETQKQTRYIEEDKIEKFTESLEKRQKWMNETDSLDKLILAVDIKKQTEDIQNIAKEILGIVGKIQEIDNKNFIKVNEMFDEISAQIKGVRNTKSITNAYFARQIDQHPSYYIDKKR